MINRSSIQRCSRSVFLAAVLTQITACRRAADFNILGSFFPGWLVCIVIGICLAYLARRLLLRWKLEQKLKAVPLVYVSLAVFFACALWLMLFE